MATVQPRQTTGTREQGETQGVSRQDKKNAKASDGPPWRCSTNTHADCQPQVGGQRSHDSLARRTSSPLPVRASRSPPAGEVPQSADQATADRRGRQQAVPRQWRDAMQTQRPHPIPSLQETKKRTVNLTSTSASLAMVSAKLFSVRLTTASSLAAATVPTARTVKAAAAAIKDLRAMMLPREGGTSERSGWGTGPDKGRERCGERQQGVGGGEGYNGQGQRTVH